MTTSFKASKVTASLLLALAAVAAIAFFHQSFPVQAPERVPSQDDHHVDDHVEGADSTETPATKEVGGGHRAMEHDPDRHRREVFNHREALFQAEPPSPAWAAESEAFVMQMLSPEHLAELGAPEPVSKQVACRSQTCRIEVGYASEMEHEMGQAFLVGDIAQRLPRATGVVFPEADGGIRIVLYARMANAK